MVEHHPLLAGDKIYLAISPRPTQLQRPHQQGVPLANLFLGEQLIEAAERPRTSLNRLQIVRHQGWRGYFPALPHGSYSHQTSYSTVISLNFAAAVSS
jgi:hypothetical protein